MSSVNRWFGTGLGGDVHATPRELQTMKWSELQAMRRGSREFTERDAAAKQQEAFQGLPADATDEQIGRRLVELREARKQAASERSALADYRPGSTLAGLVNDRHRDGWER
ncbi:hypothetical protein [Nocardia gamkensis]|uniref:hypothetical protein n=1 Tax=Nocardia gamkensis TaxID=352869 RepID=UPI0037CBDDCF